MGYYLWKSSNIGGSSAYDQMKLDEFGTLTLYASGSRSIVLTPGASSGVGKIELKVGGTTETVLTQTAANSLYLNQTTADGRYLAKSSVTSNLTFGSGATAGSVSNALSVGYNTSATGQASVALGNATTSTGTGSVALGNGAYARGTGSVALGQGSTGPSSQFAFAAGAGAYANNYSSIALGMYNQSTGYGSVAAGYGAYATGYGAVAVGYYNHASGMYSGAFGIGAAASGVSSVAIGQSAASGGGALALGGTASGGGAVTVGGGSVSSATSSVAIGRGTAAANYSTAIAGAETKGLYSTALGFGAQAYGPGQVATGVFSDPLYTLSGGVGPSTYTMTDALFVIGNGYLHPIGQPQTRLPVGVTYNEEDHVMVRSNAFLVRWNGNAEASGKVISKSGIEATEATAVTKLKGTVLIQQQGDLSMGSFTAGPQP